MPYPTGLQAFLLRERRYSVVDRLLFLLYPAKDFLSIDKKMFSWQVAQPSIACPQWRQRQKRRRIAIAPTNRRSASGKNRMWRKRSGRARKPSAAKGRWIRALFGVSSILPPLDGRQSQDSLSAFPFHTVPAAGSAAGVWPNTAGCVIIRFYSRPHPPSREVIRCPSC